MRLKLTTILAIFLSAIIMSSCNKSNKLSGSLDEQIDQYAEMVKEAKSESDIEALVSGYESICKQCAELAEKSLDGDKKAEEMLVKVGEKMDKIAEPMSKIQDKFSEAQIQRMANAAASLISSYVSAANSAIDPDDPDAISLSDLNNLSPDEINDADDEY